MSIKRISILVRRPQDTREVFSLHWHATHGPLVAQLPAIAAYSQNHVISVSAVDTVDGYDIDGIVELYFSSEENYRNAFANAESVWRDEPHFLAHSTAYRIKRDLQPPAAYSDAKLMIVAAGAPGAISWLGDQLSQATPSASVELDQVEQVVPRTTMVRGPQPADGFFHLRFESEEAANHAAQRLVQQDLAGCKAAGIERLAVVRVKERPIIA